MGCERVEDGSFLDGFFALVERPHLRRITIYVTLYAYICPRKDEINKRMKGNLCAYMYVYI
jgi:hypothetical protein